MEMERKGGEWEDGSHISLAETALAPRECEDGYRSWVSGSAGERVQVDVVGRAIGLPEFLFASLITRIFRFSLQWEVLPMNCAAILVWKVCFMVYATHSPASTPPPIVATLPRVVLHLRLSSFDVATLSSIWGKLMCTGTFSSKGAILVPLSGVPSEERKMGRVDYLVD